MTRTFEIIKDLVANMDLTTKVTVNGNRLETCNTLHVRNQSIITDAEGKEFKVTDFEFNSFVEVSPLTSGDVWAGDVMTAPKPTFLQGKWMSANNEYLQMSNRTADKTPLIWLVRGYREEHGGKMDSIKLEVEPLIYFLDQADFARWTNDEHDSEAINPMYNLARLFVDTVEKEPKIRPLERYTIEDEPRFGVKITSDKGNSKRIISDDLSGVGLRIPLKITKNCINC